MIPNQGIDFGPGVDWVAMPQKEWLEWACDPNFPDYMRAVYVAHGKHRANGHAPLGQGELAMFLMRKTGEIPDRRTVWSAIDKAVKKGYLAHGSRALCLIVSRARSQFGKGNATAPCARVHASRREREGARRDETTGRFSQNDGSETSPFEPNDGSEHRPFGEGDGSEHRPFTLSPSCLVSPQKDAPRSGSTDAERKAS